MHPAFCDGFEKTGKLRSVIRSVRAKPGPKIVNVPRKAQQTFVNAPRKAQQSVAAPVKEEAPKFINIPKQKYLADQTEAALAQKAESGAAQPKDWGHLPSIAAGVGGAALGYSLAN